MSDWTRRNLLRCGLSAAAGLSTPNAMLGLLGGALATSAQAAFLDYKALVCVFLYGGNDGYNVLVPSDFRYGTYAAARGGLAVPGVSLLPLFPQLLPLSLDFYGVHPSMPELQSLYGLGRLAFVANVGTLLAPTTKDDYAQRRNLPPRLFSHNDQQDQWVSSTPDANTRLGWGGRLADLMGSVNANRRLSMNISIGGNNLFQIGQNTVPYSLSTGGVRKFDANTGARSTVFRELLNQAQTRNSFERYGAQLNSRSIDTGMEVDAALSAVPDFFTSFPSNNSLADQLQIVAKMIAARNTLSVSRQVFFVSMGGFDTHDDQLVDHPGLLSKISQAFGSFNSVLDELGVANSVTTFTGSDFGRTLTSNGDGTDHAWGNVQWVMGGAVAGRQVAGQFPNQTLDGPQDAGQGRIIPTSSVEQYGATLLRWFGASESEIDTVFPHLSRFGSRSLNFMFL